MTSSNGSTTYGNSVTVTATVTPTTGSGETGTVQFQIDGSNVGSPVNVSNNTATYTMSSLAGGAHSVVAVYSGDTNFASSTSSTITQTVNRAATSISGVTASQSVSFGTASIVVGGTVNPNASGAYPTGTVTVSIDGINATSSGISAANGSFSATFNPSAIPASTTPYTITYSYAGDGNYSAAANDTSTTLTVNRAATSISGVTASQAISYGTGSVTLGGIVDQNGTGGYPTGTVTVGIDGVQATSSSISATDGSFTATFSPGVLPASTTPYTITYSYVGDSNYGAPANNTSTTLTVNRAATSISGVTASQSVSFGTASIVVGGTVNPNASGAYPTGTVTVSIDGINATSSGISAANGSFTATFSPGVLPASTTPYTITYSYAGDSNYSAAANNTSTTLTVNRAATSISGVTASQAISYGTGSVTLGGIVDQNGTGAYPTGTVTVSIDGVQATSSSISATDGSFTATFSPGVLPASATPYTITYSYAGDGNYSAAADDGSTALTINPEALIVTANPEAKIIGESDPAFTYQVSGLVNGDTAAEVVSGSLTRASGEDLGTYAIGQGTLAINANPNYTLGSFTGDSLYITNTAWVDANWSARPP